MANPTSQRKAAIEATANSHYLKLPLRQQAFIDEYIKDLNAYQAAKRSGYTPNVAYEILKLPTIQNALKEIRDGIRRLNSG